MSYLIDGNNVMGQRVGWHRDKRGARRGLLAELAQFAAGKRVRVVVVFDGAPDEFFPDGASYRGVRVHYAARGSNADERIKALVEAARERKTLRVVTSDRALATYVRQCGVEVLSAGAFRQLMTDTEMAAAPPAEKQEIEADETHWLRYFGVAAEDDEAS
jgi:predicted RNA-binding protein with PIN domain